MGEHEGKAGVIADGADIAEMVGKPLELGHQGAQPNRARRNFDFQRRFNSAGEGKGIGGRAVAGCPRREPRGRLDGRPGHEQFDPLMSVAQTLFQPDHGLAIRGKAEMAGLDDAGMHRVQRRSDGGLRLPPKEKNRVLDRLAARRFWPRDGADPSGHDRARGASRAGPRDQGQRDPGSPAPAGSPEDAAARRRETVRRDIQGSRPQSAFGLSSRRAMWTAALSPQRPSKVSRPSASLAAKSCQRSSSR